MNYHLLIMLSYIYLISSISAYGMLYQTSREKKRIEALIKQQLKQLKPHGLLFFLDETETKTNPGTITYEFLKALIDKAGPIIVNYTLIKNVEVNEKERDPQFIQEQFNQLKQAFQNKQISFNEYGKALLKLAIASTAINTSLDKNWVMKEINNDLYLLIPKQYLKSKNIHIENASIFTKEADLTKTELTLGLKINHMKTVTLDTMQMSYWREYSTIVTYAYYFIKSLWNTKNDTSTIFITNKEYARYKSIAPLWAFFIGGHGELKKRVTGISIEDFRTFLTFLEKKIKTSMVYYKACYAIGLNSAIIFKDAESALDKTYPFMIITDAIPDAVAQSMFEPIKENRIKVITDNMYSSFIKEVESADVIDYRKIAHLLTTKEERSTSRVLPQVKLPGLEWFSVIDMDKTVSIGRVLASKRTNPLNIATFFAKKGKKAEPDSILLYATNILFELIINTPTMPSIISMIPGEAAHHCAMISSSVHTVDTMINSFMKVPKLGVTKIFNIDTLIGKNSDIMQKIIPSSTIEDELTLKDVIITISFDDQNNRTTYTIIFKHDDIVYEMNDLLTINTIARIHKK